MAQNRSVTVSRRELLRKAAAGVGIAGLVGTTVGTTGEVMAESSKADYDAVLHGPESKATTMLGVPFERIETVRTGIIGVGGRGMGVMANLLGVEGVQVKAVCDISPERAQRAAGRIEKDGQLSPTLYTKNETDYENLCRRDDLDLVLIATPWDWHVPMAVFAMKQGKHVAVEVPAAVTLADCWKLVETSEQTRRHCVMLENCCYGWNEMLVLNMVKDGVLGELTHGEAAYIHDLRALLFADSGEGTWRRKPHQTRNGNLYPTHGLGPVAWYMGIHRGDRFDSMVSMSSVERGLSAYRAGNLDKDDAKQKETYRCGDMNTSIIKTALGRTILLQHDVISPRPYSRINLISGTKGTFEDYPPRIYIDGETKGHDWETLDRFKEKYEHPLWKRVGELARKLGGHGGMDFIMGYRLVQCMQEGLPPDIDVYDTAAWSAPGPLSDSSVAKGGMPQKFPDFTRGHWEKK
jgi:predicted dehydrogenase